MNVYTVRNELEKAGITVWAVIESGNRSPFDELRINNCLRVQVAADGSYCALVEEKLDGTLMFSPSRTRVKDLVKDVVNWRVLPAAAQRSTGALTTGSKR